MSQIPCFGTDHLKHKTVNGATYRTPLENPWRDFSADDFVKLSGFPNLLGKVLTFNSCNLIFEPLFFVKAI